MKLRPLLFSAFAMTMAHTLSAADDADALWQKVDDALSAMKQRPATPPKSREESLERFKKLVQATDEAGKIFLAKFPNDARRWKIRMFEAMTSKTRPQLGLPEAGDMKKLLMEISTAADADAETKSEASAILVLESASGLEDGSGDADGWKKQAEAHLKAFPDQRFNSSIQSKIENLKVMADLKTKPLDLKFTALDGREVDLASLRGKVVLIDFWAVWCGPCVAELPNVLKAYEKLHPKGFEIIGISLDSDKSKLESFVKEKNMPWAQYFDGKSWKNEISSRFGINSIPAMWLVDKKGMVVSTNVRGKLEETVEKYLAE